MKNFKAIAAFTMAAIMVTLASCSKEGTGTPAGGDRTTDVKIEFSYPENPATRAEGSALADGTAGTFKPGHILFTTSAGTITTHATIDKSIGGTVQNFTLSQLTNPAGSEVVIAGVSSSATRCYIISNDLSARIGGATGITTDLTGSNISTVMANTIAVSDMNDDNAGIENVPLYGVGNVVGSPAGSETNTDEIPYTAQVNVQINSLASHLQIKKFSAKNATVGSNVIAITAFTVDGIYINNVNPTMTVAGTLGAIVDNGSVVANYTTGGTTSYSATGSLAKLVDEPAALDGVADGSPLALVPSTGTVWAYNVFPQTSVPHIVVKLSGVKYTIDGGEEHSVSGNQWLSIGSYKEDATPVLAFAANQIYTFSDIQFDYTDLTIVPEASNLDVQVSVTMFNWTEHELVWNN